MTMARSSRLSPSWSTPDSAPPHSRDLELRDEALRLGHELLRGTKYEE
jgi:hypothetical protein